MKIFFGILPWIEKSGVAQNQNIENRSTALISFKFYVLWLEICALREYSDLIYSHESCYLCPIELTFCVLIIYFFKQKSSCPYSQIYLIFYKSIKPISGSKSSKYFLHFYRLMTFSLINFQLLAFVFSFYCPISSPYWSNAIFLFPHTLASFVTSFPTKEVRLEKLEKNM